MLLATVLKAPSRTAVPSPTVRAASKNRRPRVLLLDSGVGGLSVLDAIRRRLPEAEAVYVADTGFYPYGIRADEALIGRVPALLKALCRRYAPDLVVIACNTASTLVLPATRAALSVPVVGCVPAIKPAAARGRSIGILGTPGTVRRAYTDDLVARFAADHRIVRHGSAELVALAERKLSSGRIAPEIVAEAVAPLFDQGETIDAVVLACTHFPLLRAELEAAAPYPVDWIDSAEAIARRVESLLGRGRGGARKRRGESGDIAVATSRGAALERLEACLPAHGFARVEAFTTQPLPSSARPFTVGALASDDLPHSDPRAAG